jgi:hypothetical protein
MARNRYHTVTRFQFAKNKAAAQDHAAAWRLPGMQVYFKLL